MTWRNCGASLTLIDEINKRWPARSRVSDGTIGDAAHATRVSDHNPWLIINGQGIVRARDITGAGIDTAWLCEHLRALGATGDGRLNNGGYLIYNRRITTPNFAGWKTYTGSNPHTQHVHVSFSQLPAGFDSTRPWGIWPAAAPSPTPRGFLMALSDAEQAEVLEAARSVLFGIAGRRSAGPMALSVATVQQDVGALRKEVGALHVVTPSGPAVLTDADVQRIANAVIGLLGAKASA